MAAGSKAGPLLLNKQLKVVTDIATGAFSAPFLSCTCAKGLAVGVTLIQEAISNPQAAPASLPASQGTSAAAVDQQPAPVQLPAVLLGLQELPQEVGMADAAASLSMRMMLLRQGCE